MTSAKGAEEENSGERAKGEHRLQASWFDGDDDPTFAKLGGRRESFMDSIEPQAVAQIDPWLQFSHTWLDLVSCGA